jgi:hypothetical protein
MERNEGNEGGLGANAGQTNANEFSGSATPSSGTNAGFDFSGATGTSEQSQGIRDRARNVIDTAGNRLADVGSTVREKAGTAKDRLADALESGAQRLRDRTHGGAGAPLAAATPEGSTQLPSDGRIAQVSDRVAGGMERSAEWLRDADIDSLKSGIENQVKEHPGRTLLIAVGLGYLIGRAFRGNQ